MITDPRRLGQAQRRRIGASSNVYDTTINPPSHGVGDTVRAKGRYGVQTVVGVYAGIARPQEGGDDGHGYIVQGGKRGRTSTHFSTDLKPLHEKAKDMSTPVKEPTSGLYPSHVLGPFARKRDQL